MTGITGKYKAHPDGIYLFKGNNTNTRKKVWNMFKVNNKKKTRSSVFIANFEHILHLFLVLLLPLKK